MHDCNNPEMKNAFGPNELALNLRNFCNNLVQFFFLSLSVNTQVGMHARSKVHTQGHNFQINEPYQMCVCVREREKVMDMGTKEIKKDNAMILRLFELICE